MEQDQPDELIQEGDIYPGCSTFDEFLQVAYPSVMNGVRCSNALPNSQRFGFYNTYSEFRESMKTEGQRLQNTIQNLLKYCGTRKKLTDQTLMEKFDLITDLNDRLLDRVVKNLMEIDGVRFNPYDDFGEGPAPASRTTITSKKEISGSWNKKSASTQRQPIENSKNKVLYAKTGTIRPQVFFKDKIDNRNIPWVPAIKEKPNSLKPLSVLLTVNEKGQECYSHPYEYELRLWRPRDEMLQLYENVSLPKALEDTPLVMVETEAQLEGLLGDLEKYVIIGVDLEHHSYRSFMGFTCVIQISTEDTDYVIDALKLRHVLYKLNEIFTRPTVLKVFHGANNDIEWLQRDFNVYVVNMFDTFQAAKALDFPKLAYSYLLQEFCRVSTNKSFQLFDWRIRPLPEQAVHYARQDTHYLTYIYKMMNNKLIERAQGKTNILEAVYSKCCEVCQRVYMKPVWEEESYMHLYQRAMRNFDNRQLYSLKEIYKWRDNVARIEDESPGYVLSNHMMIQICQTLPREIQGILACCNPIPPLVRQHLLELHQIILRAKDQPLVKSLPEDNSKTSELTSRDFETESRLMNYLHDNSNLEFRDDLPTLLGGDLPPVDEPPTTDPKLKLLATPPKKLDATSLSSEMSKISFVSPYERYKRVLPYSIQEEKERLEEEKKKEAEEAAKGIEKQNFAPQQLVKQKSPSPVPLSRQGASKKMKFHRPSATSSVNSEDSSSLVHQMSERDAKIKRERDDEIEAHQPSVGGAVTNETDSTTNYSRGQGRNKRGRRSDQNSRKSGNKREFVPHDYKKVDYSKFKRGKS